METKITPQILALYLGCETNLGTLITVKMDEAVMSSKLGGYINARDFSQIKLILRPLSTMSIKEKEYLDNNPEFGKPFKYRENMAAMTAYLLSKHFDLFGLIESGDALVLQETAKNLLPLDRMERIIDKGGRPAHFETPEELQKAIDDYLKEAKPPTISGLAYALGFESRQSFYDYEKRDGFSYTIKKARLFMESHYEGKLQGNNPAGSIFWLKNAGWTDKQEIDQKTTLKDERIDTTNLTDEELRILAEIQRKSGVSQT